MINSTLVDIAVYGNDKQLKLVIEVKARRGTTRDWAAKLRRNLYVNQFIPEVPFYLIALPDQFYLWKNIQNPNEVVLPDYQVNPQPFLSPYYSLTEWNETKFFHTTFELIMMSWLNQIINLETPETLDFIYQDWLLNSGLYEAIRGGEAKLEISR
ncbi:hypothetical protein [Gloeothece verrucosa]|uniref:Uncharacterized protein n=1 Tax=Gloeothece verrucosa (strain PCC 7822) TaxID=497965 RepID=E0U8F1_GLOV7|nr:hypothetical protein [Gloeothece verrucosa]ADN12587.1 hypothetical protein Cyan7822_0548 [Gloeothece verrucosa PCC 7822]